MDAFATANDDADLLGQLIPTEEAAKLLRQKPQTLAVWRSKGRGPRYYVVGRRVFYTPPDLADYVSKQLREPA